MARRPRVAAAHVHEFHKVKVVGYLARGESSDMKTSEDADTSAALVGQLAGAFHGVSQIPFSWISCVAWRERIIETASSLFDQSNA